MPENPNLITQKEFGDSQEVHNPPLGTKLSGLLLLPEQTINTPFFRILVTGPLQPNKLTVTYDPTRKAQFPVATQARIDNEWQNITTRNPHAFPGPLVRLDSLGMDQAGNLVLELGPTDYREYRGTVALSPNERKDAGYELAHPLGVAMMVTASNNKGNSILVSQRATDLVHRPQALEFPAGNISLKDTDPDGTINPLVAALRETEEEQGIKPSELENLQVEGVVYEDLGDAAPVIIISGALKPDIPMEEITRRQKDSEGRQIWLADDPPSLVRLILDNSLMSLPLVQAGLYFAVRKKDPRLASFIVQRSKRRGRVYTEKLSPLQVTTIESRKRARLKI